MKKLHGTPGPSLGGRWAGLRELRRAAPVLALASASPGLQAQKPEEGSAALKYWVGQNSHLGFTGTNFLVNPSECWPSSCVPHSLSVVSYWPPESLSSHTWGFMHTGAQPFPLFPSASMEVFDLAVHHPGEELQACPSHAVEGADWGSVGGSPRAETTRPQGLCSHPEPQREQRSGHSSSWLLGSCEPGWLSLWGKKKLTQPPRRFWGK